MSLEYICNYRILPFIMFSLHNKCMLIWKWSIINNSNFTKEKINDGLGKAKVWGDIQNISVLILFKTGQRNSDRFSRLLLYPTTTMEHSYSFCRAGLFLTWPALQKNLQIDFFKKASASSYPAKIFLSSLDEKQYKCFVFGVVCNTHKQINLIN